MARNQHEHPIRLRITPRKARAGIRCGPFGCRWRDNLAPVFPQSYACEHLLFSHSAGDSAESSGYWGFFMWISSSLPL